jgi:hypothetical protein
MESVVIHADFGAYRLFSVARLLEISFQRAQHLVKVNYTFFWQLIPRFRLAAQKYTSLATTLKRAPEVLTSRGRRDKPTQTLNTPAQLRFVRLGSRFVTHTDVLLRICGSSIWPAQPDCRRKPCQPLTAMEHIWVTI